MPEIHYRYGLLIQSIGYYIADITVMIESFASARTQLLDLSLRVPVSTAREVAQRLRNSESQYSIYSNLGPVSKGTAKKIKDLLDQGKLGFLFDLQMEEDSLNEAASSAESVQPSLPRHPDFEKLNSVGINRRSLELMKNLPKFSWRLETLESAGIPTEDSLILLQSYVELSARIVDWNLAELDRFSEIHYIVSFHQENSALQNPGPYDLIILAASVFSKGVVDSNSYLMQAGRGVLRFQVWRGAKFFQAYEESQVPTHRAARQAKQRMMERIEALFPALLEIPEESDSNG